MHSASLGELYGVDRKSEGYADVWTGRDVFLGLSIAPLITWPVSLVDVSNTPILGAACAIIYWVTGLNDV